MRWEDTLKPGGSISWTWVLDRRTRERGTGEIAQCVNLLVAKTEKLRLRAESLRSSPDLHTHTISAPYTTDKHVV